MKRLQPEDLLNDFLQGDTDAFTQIVKMHNRALRYFSWTMVKDREAAEEIANDSFFKLWQSRGNFDSMAAIRSFLYVVTRNACLNYVQSPRHRQRAGMVEAEQLLSSDPDVESRLIELELLDAIYREIEKLPQKQRDVFRLVFFEGLTVQEISEKLGITANAVYLNKSLAVKSLQHAFKGYDVMLYLAFLTYLGKN
ncbi:RNA polymerase sigma factor [Parapedobacter sp. GCM10030251]|uniref:RNA polymerase sigma factor n=1 Tax=Parapedobacter sp. GCM10030251 TaxID=3273419 RepID=UPI00360AB79D